MQLKLKKHAHFSLIVSVFFSSQLVVNDQPVRARCVTAVQGTVVLMREEDGQATPTTHTALCLSLCPPSLA